MSFLLLYGVVWFPLYYQFIFRSQACLIVYLKPCMRSYLRGIFLVTNKFYMNVLLSLYIIDGIRIFWIFCLTSWFWRGLLKLKIQVKRRLQCLCNLNMLKQIKYCFSCSDFNRWKLSGGFYINSKFFKKANNLKKLQSETEWCCSFKAVMRRNIASYKLKKKTRKIHSCQKRVLHWFLVTQFSDLKQ